MARASRRSRPACDFTSEDRKFQNFARDLELIIAIDFDAEVGTRIKRTARFEEFSNLFAIRGEGPCAVVVETLVHTFDGAVEPDSHAVILDQLPVLRLREGSATERNDAWMAGFNALHAPANGFSFEGPKRFFALRFEDPADRCAFLSFDIVVDVGERPTELIGQGAPDGGLAAGHKSNKIKPRSAL